MDSPQYNCNDRKMIDPMGWPYDSSDCLLLSLENGANELNAIFWAKCRGSIPNTVLRLCKGCTFSYQKIDQCLQM